MDYCKKLKVSHGYSLIEVTISLFIFILFINLSTGILNMMTKRTKMLEIEQEMLQNANIAIKYIEYHVKMGDNIVIYPYKSSRTLKRLDIESRLANDDMIYRFDYNPELNTNDVKYHRLEFASNELAKYIKDIQVTIDGDNKLMTVSVFIDDIEFKNGKIEGISLIKYIDIRYKNVYTVG